MVEATGMGAIKLDVAVYTIRALNDLAEMADSKGDTATRDWAAMKASALTKKFTQDWWIPSQGLFADSLALNSKGADRSSGSAWHPTEDTQLEQLYWINATPMETSFASVLDASMRLPPTRVFYLYRNDRFLSTRSSPAIKGSRQASAVNTGVMAIAEANYGRMDQSLRYVNLIADELDVEQPGALPELFDSPDYTYFPAHSVGRWSCKPGLRMAFTGRCWSCTLGSSRMLPQKLCRSCQTYPVPGKSSRLTICTSARLFEIAVSVRRAGINYVTTVSAPVGWSLTIGYTLPAKTQVKSVRLNDSPAAFQIVPTNRGEEIHVQTNSGGTQEVRIQTE